MSLRHITLCLVSSASFAATAIAAEPTPAPDKPLQTKPETSDDSFVLQGWAANIQGVSGEGKTSLVIAGEDGYTTTATIDDVPVTKTHPAVFELGDKDYRIAVKVKDTRGAEWSETVDVPKGLKVTVEIKAQYEHRGFEGTIKNDTLTCRNKAQRRFMKFEIYQGGTMVGNSILLEPGKSAPGVRLKPGQYDLKVFAKVGADYRLLKTATLDPKAAQWRYDATCE